MMSSVNQKINQVNEKFYQRSIKVDHEWLSDCVNWFIEEDPAISINQLYDQANEQWQLSDLSDSGVPCLPESIFVNKQVHMINGNYPLQIQYLLDITEPAYDQRQKIYNQQIDEPKEQPEYRQNQNSSKKKRVMKMELTDGRRAVTALEYMPIACLTTKLPPGTKTLLTGPMRCINHILFLEPKNIKIIGGEVESLLISNAYENILLRTLNQPLNPKPVTNYNENNIRENTQAPRINLPVIPMQSAVSTRNAVDSTRAIDHFNDDDLLCDIDIDQLAATAIVQPTVSETYVAASSRVVQQSLLQNEHDSSDLLLGEIDIFDNDIDVNRQAGNTVEPNMDISIRSDDMEIVDNDRAQPKTPDITDENYPFKIRGINLVTIKQLQNISDEDKRKRQFFMIKAEIDAVIKTAHISRNEWSLGVLLNDDDSANLLQVKFSSPVLEKLTNVSPQEMRGMHERSRVQPQVAQDIKETLTKLTVCLEELHCYMKIQYVEGLEFPVVVELIDPAPVLERKLKQKLEKEK